MGKKGAKEEDGNNTLQNYTHYPHSEGVEDGNDVMIELSRMVSTIDIMCILQ